MIYSRITIYILYVNFFANVHSNKLQTTHCMLSHWSYSEIPRVNNETGPMREFRALLRTNCSSTCLCHCVCLTLKDWCYWSNETSALSMAEIVSHKRGNMKLSARWNMKLSARCGKGWSSPTLHMMDQSHLSLFVRQCYLCCFRYLDLSDDPKASIARYVITNPPGDFQLHPTDKAYVFMPYAD